MGCYAGLQKAIYYASHIDILLKKSILLGQERINRWLWSCSAFYFDFKETGKFYFSICGYNNANNFAEDQHMLVVYGN